MNFKIREATTADFALIYNLICELVGIPVGGIPTNKLAEIFSTNLQFYNKGHYIAESSGSVVGFISITLDLRLSEAGKVIVIDELVVRKSCRGNGIGSALLNHVVGLAKAADCCMLEVATNLCRKDTHHFYEKNSFNKNGYRFGFDL